MPLPLHIELLSNLHLYVRKADKFVKIKSRFVEVTKSVRKIKRSSCRIYFGIPQDICACLVYDLQVADFSIVNFSRGMPICIGMTRVFFDFIGFRTPVVSNSSLLKKHWNYFNAFALIRCKPLKKIPKNMHICERLLLENTFATW